MICAMGWITQSNPLSQLPHRRFSPTRFICRGGVRGFNQFGSATDKRYSLAVMKLIRGSNWTHWLAFLVAAFATTTIIEFFAVDACLDRGGRVADSGWSCETASGAIEPLLLYLSAWSNTTIIVVVGISMFLVVASIFDRLFSAGGKRDG